MEEHYWPAENPDLNPTEPFWDELEWRLKVKLSRPTSVSNLTKLLLEEWQKFP